MSPTVSALLRDYVETGKLDRHSAVEVLNESEVLVVNLRAARLQAGIGREFLQALKRLNVRIHIEHPVRDALPFWRKMRTEGLVDDDPDAQPTWEDFATGLECQMTADKSFALPSPARTA